MTPTRDETIAFLQRVYSEGAASAELQWVHPAQGQDGFMVAHLHGNEGAALRPTYDADKQGSPVFLHAVAVEARLPANAPEYARLAALLHDVVEDTLPCADCGRRSYTISDLREMGYPEEALAIVELLTFEEDKTKPRSERLRDYRAFIQRIVDSGNEWAIRIKQADIMENSSRPRNTLIPRHADMDALNDAERQAFWQQERQREEDHTSKIGYRIVKYTEPLQMLARAICAIEREQGMEPQQPCAVRA